MTGDKVLNGKQCQIRLILLPPSNDINGHQSVKDDSLHKKHSQNGDDHRVCPHNNIWRSNHTDQPKDQHLYEFYLIVCKQLIYPVLTCVHIQGRSCADDLKKNAYWTVCFFRSGIDLTEVKSGFPSLGMSCRPTWWCRVASPEALAVSPGINRATIRWPVTCGHCDDCHSSSAVMFAA